VSGKECRQAGHGRPVNRIQKPCTTEHYLPEHPKKIGAADTLATVVSLAEVVAQFQGKNGLIREERADAASGVRSSEAISNFKQCVAGMAYSSPARQLWKVDRARSN
jgi:hypothetical protein